MAHETLSLFHPLIGRWFAERIGTPTDVQAKAWPEIAAGRHVLVTAPTGTGKTLTAFLWAINQLVVGEWELGRVRVLYVSPLKALNNDVRRNLLRPLAELGETFAAAGQPMPQIHVFTRSGDTEPAERRRMLSHPPEILITTPESLNIILSSQQARLLTGISTVILDEIHSIAGGKRGTHLITAVDRLVRLTGDRSGGLSEVFVRPKRSPKSPAHLLEGVVGDRAVGRAIRDDRSGRPEARPYPRGFQRIALSATVKPLDVIADFVGGYEMHEHAGGADGVRIEYRKRRVSVIQSSASKTYDVCVRAPENARSEPGTWWAALVRELRRIIARNRSTLLFTNNRRLCEKIALLINEGEPKPLAYSHHGSLSRETRVVVEERLKRGELAAIVATNSLELGIDIGALDEVVLIQTPNSISSAVQRVGRAGHQVGETSRGELFPTFGRDFLSAAVVAPGILRQDIESIRPISAPLDVLAQVIVSMTATETWELDKLYAFLRTSYPYRDLSRKHFDLVTEMLAGRYADTRLRELRPLVSIDRIDAAGMPVATIRGREGAARRVYMAGGTIPDRGYFNLRHAATNARIGQLDEEFVWESDVGEAFILGTQAWKIERITHNDVFVLPAGRRPARAPFWRAEEINREYHLSERIAEFLETADAELDDPRLADRLKAEHLMDGLAANELAEFLRRQKTFTGAPLPHRHHVLIEHCAYIENPLESRQVIIHTLWGGTVNRPFALALAAAWEAKYGSRLEVYTNNDSISLVVPSSFNPRDLLTLVSPDQLETLLRRKLEQTGFFGARFRENAARALLLTRQSYNKRLPLWLNRLRSKKLLDAIARFEDFPILVETWRTCLQDEFDLPQLRRLLDELRSGVIRTTEATTPAPSPFAEDIVWYQTNKFMYMDDAPEAAITSRLRDDLLKELVFSSELRPAIPQDVVRQFQQKLHRVAPGYAPGTPLELLDWVKERMLIPQAEWDELLAATERDSQSTADELLRPVAGRLALVRLPGSEAPAVVAAESVHRLLAALQVAEGEAALAPVLPGVSFRLPPAPAAPPAAEDRDPAADWLGQWLQFYGPVSREFITRTIGIPEQRLNDIIETLLDTRQVVVDELIEGSTEVQVCDSENLEILLRLTRAQARPSFTALPADRLALFLAARHGLNNRGSGMEDLRKALEKLLGFPAPPELWETDILPARLWPYQTAWMDSLMQQSDLIWFGRDRLGRRDRFGRRDRKVVLCFSYNLDLLQDELVGAAPRGRPGAGTGACPYKITEPEQEDQDERARPPAARIIPDQLGRYSFASLLQFTKKPSAELARELWEAVWRGEVTNDLFAALRSGILNKFRSAAEPGASRRPSRRAGLARWTSSRPFAGNWYALRPPEMPGDSLEREELNKDRVRLLLDRYGIFFRELLGREVPSLHWGGIFRALRLMELSGEILSGYFFEGIPGLQFISHDAFRELQGNSLPQDAVFWINATDPVSLCGLGVDELSGSLPPRVQSTHLVYHGTAVVMISRRNGKELDIRVAPDHRRLAEYFRLFRDFLTRQFLPMKSVVIETINGEPAQHSPYLAALRTQFDLSADYRGVRLWKPVP
ncbi:MAG TPA: DEAD/DEAH box helicase [Planctomycetota bacterium]|nr:DEAD/DEAH box helicase [Planctomycetota bacterium]